MFNIDLSVLAKLIANPGLAYVLPNNALVVLEGKLYVIPGVEFAGMNEEEFNKKIQELCK